MSSMTNATARPVSTIWNASAWPFAEMMFMPRFCAALISVICLMLVVPAVETMVLPFRSASDLMLEDFLATQRYAVRRGDELVLDLELGHLQLALHRVHDPQAQIHRVADRLLLVVVVGERDRGVAVSAGDRAAVLDVFQGAFLRRGGSCDGQGEGGKNQRDRSGHVGLLVGRSSRRLDGWGRLHDSTGVPHSLAKRHRSTA